MFSLSIKVLFLLRFFNKRLAAVAPISNAGCVMVVSEGLSSGAVLRFEKQSSLT
jgi:hypothetical protein